MYMYDRMYLRSIERMLLGTIRSVYLCAGCGSLGPAIAIGGVNLETLHHYCNATCYHKYSEHDKKQAYIVLPLLLEAHHLRNKHIHGSYWV